MAAFMYATNEHGLDRQGTALRPVVTSMRLANSSLSDGPFHSGTACQAVTRDLDHDLAAAFVSTAKLCEMPWETMRESAGGTFNEFLRDSQDRA